MSNTELNTESSLVPYVFELDVKDKIEEVKKFIMDEGVPSIYECDELDTTKFEFFLSKYGTKKTLIGVFSDNDDTKLRIEN